MQDDVLPGSMSGGTDIATGFSGISPLLPVTVGELRRPILGVAADVYAAVGAFPETGDWPHPAA